MGFSLVFPSLGVEAVRNVELVNRGSVLGIFTAFFDLALGISGPAAGVIVTHAGYSFVFLFAAIMALLALVIVFFLHRNPPTFPPQKKFNALAPWLLTPPRRRPAHHPSLFHAVSHAVPGGVR